MHVFTFGYIYIIYMYIYLYIYIMHYVYVYIYIYIYIYIYGRKKSSMGIHFIAFIWRNKSGYARLDRYRMTSHENDLLS